MPRISIPQSTELPYHISARCRNREFFPIPISDVWEIMEDYLFFISHAYEVEVLSFVLMTNHFHLIARSPKGNLSEAMNYFMGATSRAINGKAQIINQLWGTRFHRTLIDNNFYLMHAYKYVYRNPVEANLCHNAEDYPYSTLHLSLGKGRIHFPLQPDTILNESHKWVLSWINTRPLNENKAILEKSLKRKTLKFPKVQRVNGKKLSLLTELY